MNEDPKRRIEVLSDLRVLLNWLEANPDVPVWHLGIEVSYSVPGNDDTAGIQAIKAIAEAVGADVATSAGGAHHGVVRRFGTATYRATYIERDHMRRYDEHMKPYRAAS